MCVQPARKLVIFCYAMFEALGEALQRVSAVGAARGGERLLVVHFPKEQQGHPRLADGGVSGAEVVVVADPVSKGSVHLGHGDMLPRYGEGVALGLFDLLPPGTNVNSVAGEAVPAH